MSAATDLLDAAVAAVKAEIAVLQSPLLTEWSNPPPGYPVTMLPADPMAQRSVVHDVSNGWAGDTAAFQQWLDDRTDDGVWWDIWPDTDYPILSRSGCCWDGPGGINNVATVQAQSTALHPGNFHPHWFTPWRDTAHVATAQKDQDTLPVGFEPPDGAIIWVFSPTYDERTTQGGGIDLMPHYAYMTEIVGGKLEIPVPWDLQNARWTLADDPNHVYQGEGLYAPKDMFIRIGLKSANGAGLLRAGCYNSVILVHTVEGTYGLTCNAFTKGRYDVLGGSITNRLVEIKGYTYGLEANIAGVTCTAPSTDHLSTIGEQSCGVRLAAGVDAPQSPDNKILHWSLSGQDHDVTITGSANECPSAIQIASPNGAVREIDNVQVHAALAVQNGTRALRILNASNVTVDGWVSGAFTHDPAVAGPGHDISGFMVA